MARVLLHVANLFPADPEEVLDALGVDSEQEIRQHIRRGDMPMCFDRATLLFMQRLTLLLFWFSVDCQSTRAPSVAWSGNN